MRTNSQAVRNHGGPMSGNRPVRVEAPAPARIEMVASELVRARAYEIFRARQASGTCGDAVSDWLEAERELNGWSDRHALDRGNALLRDEA